MGRNESYGGLFVSHYVCASVAIFKGEAMTIRYTVYADIEAYDESKRGTNEDDCWHLDNVERDLAVFDDPEEAKKFLDNLPTKE